MKRLQQKPYPFNILFLLKKRPMFEFARSIILRGQKRAFFIFQPEQVHRAFKQWNLYLPTVTPFFAMKANSHPRVLNTVADITTNIDCASEQEMKQILGAAGTLKNAIYSHPCKDINHLRFAKDHGLPLTVVDSVEEVVKIKYHFPNAQLLCRIAVSNEHSRIVLGNKFGCPPSKLLDVVSAAGGMDVRGVSFHVGSACENPQSFVDALDKAHNALKHTGGNIVNVGGGFTNDNFPHLAEQIQKHLLPGIVYMAEPGRMMVENSFHLFLQIISKRHLVDDITEYTLNDGLYGALNNMLYDKFPARFYPFTDRCGFHIPSSRLTYPSRFWGPSCDGMDILTPDPVPAIDMPEGGWVCIPNAGAYINPGAEFNGMPVADVFEWG